MSQGLHPSVPIQFTCPKCRGNFWKKVRELESGLRFICPTCGNGFDAGFRLLEIVLPGGIEICAQDLNYSDYYPIGSRQIAGPTRTDAFLTLEMKNGQRHHFSGALAEECKKTLEAAGVAVFVHE